MEIKYNKKYITSIDGSFYSKDKTVLLRYAVGKKDTHFTIPNSVIAIGEQALYGAVNLTSITLPDALTSIGNMAFGHCISLESIKIPANVKTIGQDAFAGSNLLTQIFYDRTLAQWQAISKSYWAGALSSEYTVFCTDASVNYLGWTIIYPTISP